MTLSKLNTITPLKMLSALSSLVKWLIKAKGIRAWSHTQVDT